MKRETCLYPTAIDIQPILWKVCDPGNEGDGDSNDEGTGDASEGSAGDDETQLRDPEGALKLIKKLRQEIEAAKAKPTGAELPEEISKELKELRELKQSQESEAKQKERATLEKKGDFERILEQVKGDHAAEIQSLNAQIEALKGERDENAKSLSDFTARVERDAVEKEIVRAYYRLNGKQSKALENLVVAAVIDKTRTTEDGVVQLLDSEGKVILDSTSKQPIGLDSYLSSQEDFSIFFPPRESKGPGRDPSSTRSAGDSTASSPVKLTISRADAADLGKMRSWAKENSYSGSVTEGIASGKIAVQ